MGEDPDPLEGTRTTTRLGWHCDEPACEHSVVHSQAMASLLLLKLTFVASTGILFSSNALKFVGSLLKCA